MVMPVSLAPKPEPVIVTELPGAAFGRLVEMPGITEKVRSAMLVAGLEEPDASIV